MKNLIIFLSIFISSSLQAAYVTKKIKKSKTIIIDEKVSKGSKVCFYKSSGKRAGCGKVKKSKRSKSYVKVSGKTYKKIKVGYSTEKPSRSGRSRKKKSGLGLYVKANYIMTPLSASSYNVMVYNTPYSGDTVDTMWTDQGTGGQSFIGFGGEVGYFLKMVYLAGGVKYKLISDQAIDSNYGDNEAEFAQTITGASSLGFYFDALYPVLSKGKIEVNVGGGLDIDMSSVTVTSTQLSDDDPSIAEPLYTIDSSGMIISLRIRAEGNYEIMKNLSLSAGGVLLVGVTGAPTASVVADDPNVDQLSADITPEEDAQIALNHTAGFGAEIVLGVLYRL